MADNVGEINVVDKDGHERIKIYVDEDNDCVVRLIDAQGRTGFELILTADGYSQIFALDDKRIGFTKAISRKTV